MKREIWLPSLIMAESVGAAIFYVLFAGDWNKALYWVAAAAITWSVTHG